MQGFFSHVGNGWDAECLLNLMYISVYAEFKAIPCQTSKTKHFIK